VVSARGLQPTPLRALAPQAGLPPFWHAHAERAKHRMPWSWASFGLCTRYRSQPLTTRCLLPFAHDLARRAAHVLSGNEAKLMGSQGARHPQAYASEAVVMAARRAVWDDEERQRDPPGRSRGPDHGGMLVEWLTGCQGGCHDIDRD
jgi:hypothetical protein